MSGLKVAVFICAFSAVISGVFLGCAAGPSGSGGAGEEPPAPGEEAGACLPGGTCSEGLECLDGVCVRAEGEGEQEGDGEEHLRHNGEGPSSLA